MKSFSKQSVLQPARKNKSSLFKFFYSFYKKFKLVNCSKEGLELKIILQHIYWEFIPKTTLALIVMRSTVVDLYREKTAKKWRGNLEEEVRIMS